jgi:hypothetical protein
MSESDKVITSIEQQRDVYKALKNNPDALGRWENMMRMLGMTEESIELIKGENE